MASPIHFLKEKPQTSIVTEHRSESGDEDNYGLMAAASELLRAVESKDLKGVASALQNAFSLCESMPHDENGETK